MANRKRTDLIVIHCTAGNTADTVASIRRYHKSRGWSDIGYNVVVTGDGKVKIGRGWDRIGAHVGGYNSRSVGITWTGGSRGEQPNAAQFEGLKRAVAAAVKRYPNAKVCGHRDLSPDGDRDGTVEPHEWTKTCPLFNAEVWAAENGFPHTNFSGKIGAVSKTPRPAKGPDDRIMWLQRLLRAEGANIMVDGYDGPKTAAAIEIFEKDHGLPVTGSFDTRATVDLLKRRGDERAAPVNPARRPEEVAVIEDAAAINRVSTEKVTDGAGGVLTTIATVKEASDNVGGIVGTFASYLPEWFVPAALITAAGFFGYGWYRRNAKQKAARKVLAGA